MHSNKNSNGKDGLVVQGQDALRHKKILPQYQRIMKEYEKSQKKFNQIEQSEAKLTFKEGVSSLYQPDNVDESNINSGAQTKLQFQNRNVNHSPALKGSLSPNLIMSDKNDQILTTSEGQNNERTQQILSQLEDDSIFKLDEELDRVMSMNSRLKNQHLYDPSHKKKQNPQREKTQFALNTSTTNGGQLLGYQQNGMSKREQCTQINSSQSIMMREQQQRSKMGFSPDLRTDASQFFCPQNPKFEKLRSIPDAWFRNPTKSRLKVSTMSQQPDVLSPRYKNNLKQVAKSKSPKNENNSHQTRYVLPIFVEDQPQAEQALPKIITPQQRIQKNKKFVAYLRYQMLSDYGFDFIKDGLSNQQQQIFEQFFFLVQYVHLL